MSKEEGTLEYKNTSMPDCTGLKAYVLPGAFYGACVGLMAEAGFERALTIEECDVCVFIGGEDINPKLYGEKPHNTTSFTPARDLVEVDAYEKCLALKKPMFGICRGAQLLHAMNNGKLWQNVNGHAGNDHWIVDIEEDVLVEVTSLHHQMLRKNDKITIIAVCNEQIATVFQNADLSMRVNCNGVEGGFIEPELEIEAGAYLETGCFFVQGHPEIGNPQYRAWTMNKLDDFLDEWDMHINLDHYQGDTEIEEVITSLS